jgi:midasin (ATPase involved in ribosome maturation)
MDYMTGGGMAQTNVVMTAQQPQNFSYTSNAFDFSRGPRSKVLEAPTGFVPGPGAYEIAQPIHDYRGVYKNMGKKKNKATKKKSNEEGEEFEVESEPEPSEKSEHSENEDKETKREQPDATGEIPKEEAKPEGVRKDLIPGQS